MMFGYPQWKKRQEWLKNRKWWDIRAILSYPFQLAMVIGLRGGGKTYGAKVKVIDRFLEFGEQFVWIRRYKTELDETIKDFFGKVRSEEYLREKYGDIEYVRKGYRFYINGELAGHAISMTQASAYKSSEYPNVEWIFFDEFLPEESGSGYLRGEVNTLFGLIETIQRQDRLRVILLGNALRFNNPYFIHFGISPFKKGIKYFKNKKVLVQMYYNKWFMREKIESDFGKMTKGSFFFDFAVLNTFTDFNDKFVEKKTPESRYWCSIKFEGLTYSFYEDRKTGLMYAVNRQVEREGYTYVISDRDHNVDYNLISRAGQTLMSAVKYHYEIGNLRFENMVVREQVLSILTLI